MRIPLGIAMMLAQVSIACDSRLPMFQVPTSPNATPSAFFTPPSTTSNAANTGGPEHWLLTGTYMGHIGPENCISPYTGDAGTSTVSVLGIQRSGEWIQFSTDHDNYVGTVVAGEFSASETEDPGGLWVCGSERRLFRFEGIVSGRFSTDGRSLAAEEVALFRLDSGETISRRWRWVALPQ